MVGQDLELGVGYVPVLIGRALLENFLVLDHVIYLVLSINI